MSDFFKMSFVDIIQIGISIATLWIAYKVFKKLMPSELKKKQLEAVLDLVQHLNSYTFSMHLMRFTGKALNTSTAYNGKNIFQYGTLCKTNEVIKQNSQCKFFLLAEDIQPFDLTRFIENPLMPSEIVPRLSPFINIFFHQFKDKLEGEVKVFVFSDLLIKGCITIDPEKLIVGTGDAFTNHEVFSNAIKELVCALEKWLNANGLKDLNFREHHSRRLDA